MNIYVTREGQNYGPYSPEQAQAMIAQGQLYPGDLACPEGQQHWVPLGQILGIPPTPVAGGLAPSARPTVPLAQPATAIHPVGGAAPTAVGPAPIPNGPAAHFALQQSYLRACSAYSTLGLAAALAVIGLGIPALAWAAGTGSGNPVMAFFGQTLGLKWAAVGGLSIAALCAWWFLVQKKKAAGAKAHFEAMRGAGL